MDKNKIFSIEKKVSFSFSVVSHDLSFGIRYGVAIEVLNLVLRKKKSFFFGDDT